MPRPLKKTTKRANKYSYGTTTLPPIGRQQRDTKVNVQGREKLAEILVQKISKKLNAGDNIPLIRKEVTKFLQQEVVNEYKLKQLEQQIKDKLGQKSFQVGLKDNLTKNLKVKSDNVTDGMKPDQVENSKNQEDKLNDSGMSGGSDLDKFDVKLNKKGNDVEFVEFKKFCAENEEPKIEKVQLDYSKYANEWDAINMYNKKMFQEQQMREKLKDYEMKMRTKGDLNNQIKEKIKREYEDKLRDMEFDKMQDEHLKKMDELEKIKQQEIKAKALKEKDMRDKQMREQYVAKRIAFLKNKKFERELVEHNKEELRMEKEQEIEKKRKEHEALLKTLKDNEENQKKAKEAAKKEREDDIRMMEDHAAIEIKQENERKAYFKNIERNANVFMGQAIQGILKEQEEARKEQERVLKEYQDFENKRADEAEERRLKEIHDNKIMLRNYYDRQVADKKKKAEYEHQVDLKQADIWNRDVKKYLDREKEITKTIREMEKRNLMESAKQLAKAENQLQNMSENEKAMNREILMKANAA